MSDSAEFPAPAHSPTVNQLRDLAVAEEWDAVDVVLGDVSDNPTFLEWANTGIEDENGEIRDLAVSIIESSSFTPSPEMLSVLRNRMQVDDNPYVRFRSAFALFKHGDRQEAVVQVVKDALADDDVAEIAQRYLAQP